MHHHVFQNTILPLKDKLFRFALRILNNADEAEDIVQDAMLKFWNKRNEWIKIDNMEGYCFQTVKNLIWDRIQSKDYQNKSFDMQIYERYDEYNPFSKMVEDEQKKLIRDLISTLPDSQRAAMQLRDIEGLSYLEIANIMEVPESQVKNHLFRGRQKIKQLFDKIYNYEHP